MLFVRFPGGSEVSAGIRKVILTLHFESGELWWSCDCPALVQPKGRISSGKGGEKGPQWPKQEAPWLRARDQRGIAISSPEKCARLPLKFL